MLTGTGFDPCAGTIYNPNTSRSHRWRGRPPKSSRPKPHLVGHRRNGAAITAIELGTKTPQQHRALLPSSIL
jgi:hypothetical protein